MFQQISLESVIRDSGVLSTRPPTTLGWYEVKCAVCNDYKHRGAFKFDENGVVAYHCFNCGHRALFKPGQTSFSARMTQTLRAFGIDLGAAKRVLFHSFGSKSFKKELTPEEKILLPAPVIELPSTFVKLKPERHVLATEYIKSRGFNENTLNWYVSQPTDRIWKGRIIIPITNNNGNIVYYQGRAFNANKKRWESPGLPKTNVIFNHKLLYTNADSVIICEGVFDALSVNGIAILGSEFSQYHISELQRFKGQKILVPNKDKNGLSLAKSALKQGFSLSFPDIGTCGDLNESFVKYGQLYTEHQIYNNISTGAAAEMRLGVWCTVR